jgi:hypothetical protein
MASLGGGSSAAGFISLLDENDVALKLYALKQLDAVVHHTWMGELRFFSCSFPLFLLVFASFVWKKKKKKKFRPFFFTSPFV